MGIKSRAPACRFLCMARTTKEPRMSATEAAMEHTIRLEDAVASQRPAGKVIRAAMAMLHDLAYEPEA